MPRRHVSFQVECDARDLLRAVDEEPESFATEGQLVAEDGEVVPCLADPTESIFEPDQTGSEVEGVKVSGKRRVRRTFGNLFVNKWVSWGKAEFPGAWRTTTEADRKCIEQRLCKEMRKHTIRDRDISRFKGMIMVGICTPSSMEVHEAELWASLTIGDRARAARNVKRSWLGWIAGRGGFNWTK